MHKSLRALTCFAIGTFTAMAHAGLFDKGFSHPACPENVFVRKSDGYLIDVDSSKAARNLQPSFFGFNVEWIEFQLSLWDSARARARAELVDALKAFPGAVYRYPGGGDGAANHVNWREAEQPRGDRKKSARAGWTPPIAFDFGPDEYLDFVAEVGGTAWYIANLYGREQGEQPSSVMASEASALAAKLAARRTAGKPSVFRWELGNELDRHTVRWRPEKLTQVARDVALAIRAVDAKSTFVISQQEYPAMSKEGFTSAQYNRDTAARLKGLVDEYAIHIYYDGNGAQPPLPQKLLGLCAAIADAKSVRTQDESVRFWITEHAQVPQGMWSGGGINKAAWKGTASLQAAVSTADMLISASQIPEVQGAYIHTLHATDGPWPMFHQSADKARLWPGAVFLATRILRESMLPVVLPTQTHSRSQSGYDGGYDTHAVAMTDEARQRYALWAVNRSKSSATTSVRIPALRGQSIKASVVALSDTQLEANNYASPDRLRPLASSVQLSFDKEGVAAITLPPQAVYTLRLDLRAAVEK
ncbi:hypothetical protein [Viridibacterium curvum]|uniref:Alpha-L-arabinofuranosidase n=1 Tax=Viridibacterium curvum TaxID=1101404 RepID=A0ABP9QZY4_9RHOO